MSLGVTVTLIILVLLVLLFSGVRVGLALGIVGLFGLVFFLPGISSPERMMGNLAWSAINKPPDGRVAVTQVIAVTVAPQYSTYLQKPARLCFGRKNPASRASSCAERQSSTSCRRGLHSPLGLMGLRTISVR